MSSTNPLLRERLLANPSAEAVNRSPEEGPNASPKMEVSCTTRGAMSLVDLVCSARSAVGISNARADDMRHARISRLESPVKTTRL